MSDTSPSYTVLRIKRKATEAPLSSLVIQDGSSPAKKRREINPLGRGRGVFRLAETVPDTWVGEGEEGAVLRERIKGLLSKSDTDPPQPEASPSKEHSKDSPAEAKPASDMNDQKEDNDLNQTKDSSDTSSQTKPRQMSMNSQRRLQYRVVQPPPPRPTYGLPPKVMTYAEEARMEKEKQITFVDAEAISTASSSRKPSLPSAEEQKEMAPFLSMLEDVLKFESPAKPSSSSSSRSRIVTEDGERYVYDLYYKDNRPDHSGPVPLGVGDGVHIGALLGYGEDEEDDLDPLSEPEDEADEDSNEEDYYRNDYPEDEDADEDMEGFKDAFDDDDDDEGGGSYGGERGLWDYR